MDTKTRIKSKLRSAKGHIMRHRGAYASLATTVLWMLHTYRNSKELETFLKSKDIDPLEYWNPEYYEELNS